MDDILYILIGVLWVAISLYNRSAKKKKAAEKATPGPARPATDPMTILQELILEEAPVKPQQEYIPVEVDRPPKNRKTSDRPGKYSNYNFRDDTAGFFREGEKTTSQDKTIDTEESSIENFMDEFDLKKAVIYSEIMRAPYV